MYDSATRPRIATVRRALEAVGKTFPQPVLKALEEHDKINAAAREFTPAAQAQVADAVAECLLDDRDPATDETVRRLLASNTIGRDVAAGYGINLTPQATGRVVAALTEQTDPILAALAGPADEAGQRLAQASEMLGDQDDPQIIMAQGVAAVDAWTQAQKAKQLLATIDSAWVALATLTGFASATSNPPLRLTEADLDVYEAVNRRADAWGIVRAGGTISLANRHTYAERCQQLLEQMQHRAGTSERDRTAAVRRRFAFRP